MNKIIVHIDLNAFFVRCEEIKDNSLIGKAVAIGHEGRSGIVSTCSYEARKYGVHSGMPMFQAKEKCPNLIVKPVDFRFYHLMSSQFFNFVKTYSKIVETASIDECYVDFTSVLKDVIDIKAYFKKFQRELFTKTGLYCSIGVANSRFVAKMGSDYEKPNGITIINREDISSILYPLPIENMYGIGKKTYPRLKNIGVFTIGDLALKVKNKDLDVQNVLGKFFYTVSEWLEGYGSDEVSVEADDPKSIGHSTTLANDTKNYDEIKTAFAFLTKMVSQRAIEQGKIGKTIKLLLKNHHHLLKRSINQSH